MPKSKIILLVVIVAAIAAFFAFDLGRFLDLAFLKEQQGAIESYTCLLYTSDAADEYNPV